MKFSITVLFLLISMGSFSQSVNSPMSRDKQKHIIAGTLTGAALPFMFPRKTDFQKIMISAGIVAGASFGKEIYDGMTGNSVETLDIVYGTAGALVGATVTVYATKWLRRKKYKN